MLYRETGVFQTSYAKDQALFRISARPLCGRRLADPGLRDRAGDGLELCPDRPADAVPDHVDRSAGPERADRLLRPAQPRHRRVHGARRLHDLQAGDRLSDRRSAARPDLRRRPHPARPRDRRDPSVRPVVPRDPDHGGRADRSCGPGVRPAEPQDQGALPRRDHAGRAVLPDLAVHQGALVHQLLACRDRAGTAPDPARPRGHRAPPRRCSTAICSCWC